LLVELTREPLPWAGARFSPGNQQATGDVTARRDLYQ
jgi:hypothetical protein